MHEDALVQKIWEYIITDEFLFLIINHSNSCPCHCMNNEIMFVFDFVENHLGFLNMLQPKPTALVES